MSLTPDEAYARTEIELEQFERAAFRSLLNAVPNYYKNGRDDTYWGRQLRSIARQMARVDYSHQYHMAGSDPKYLNPADLLRYYAVPLRINRNYPGTTQYDLDLKDMILKLLKAYRMGATTESLRLVLEAYTGSDYTIEELFKSIGTYYDVSYRHTVRIGVPLVQAGNSIAKAVDDTARVRDLVRDLYTAIDLSKPAHVGINMTTVLRDSAEEVTLNLRDDLQIIMFLEEEVPGDPMIYQGPAMSPTTPHTGLSPEIQAFTYQWYRNGQPIPGKTAPDCVITATLNDTGSRYSLQVSDPILGTVWSEAALLLVSPTGTSPLPRATKPIPSSETSTGSLQIVTQPLSVSVLENTQVIFSASARNSVVPGVLSPRLNKVWEVQSESVQGLDFD